MKKTLQIFIIAIFIIFSLNLQVFADLEEDLEPTNPYVDAEAAILLEKNTGIVLYEKNADEKMYPASTTKIMTAILVLENCDLSEIVTVNASALKEIPDGYVVGGIFEGEEIPVEPLLYELLLKSANDVAVVLAEHVSGSVEEFAILMNKKAIEIGCKNTHFVNPNGIHDENHYSTARDFSLIAQYCMKNETFRKIVATQESNLPKTNKYNFADRKFNNTNELIMTGGKYYYDYATGIKTGYTKEAKSCLVASSSNNNIDLISVVFGSNSATYGKDSRFTDTINLFNYAYENYNYLEYKTPNDIITNIEVKHATKETKNLNLVISEPLICFANNNIHSMNIEPQIKLNDNISAPITKGDKLGTVSYEILGIKYTSDLIAQNDVEIKPYYLIFIGIGTIVFVLGIIIIIKNSNKKKNNRNRSRARNKR